nr:protein kinase [Lujinxingiaceae bacterium]
MSEDERDDRVKPTAVAQGVFQPRQLIAGQFEVIRKIGQGGMGEVYLARDRMLGRRVAIKTIRTSALEDYDRQFILQLFRRDAAATARLQHAHIVTIYQIGVDNETTPFMVLEYLRGEALDERLARGALSLQEALGVMRPVAAALACAHQAGLVHRDLKPGNIFIETSGNVKVLDFGIALFNVAHEALREEFARSSEELDAYLGRGVASTGTAEYMAPEQWKSQGQDHRIDIWAFGIVLYELLVGEVPFDNPKSGQALSLPDILEELPTLPQRVVELLARCVAFDREQRFGDAHALLAAIDALELVSKDDAGTSRLAESARISYTLGDDAFVGRNLELLELARHFEQGAGVVTLLGPGGTGKTRLSRQFGALSLGEWPGGVWFCDLGDVRNSEAIAAALAGVLDIPLNAQDGVGQLGNVLRGRGRALFILDNFEQIVDAAEGTLGVWVKAAPEARFLVTSRIVLNLKIERVLPLDPLPMPSEAVHALSEVSACDAVALFVARAQSVDNRFALNEDNAADVAQLVRLLDGLPLAIELAAARIAMLAPAKMLQRMNQRFQLLRSSQRDLSSRQSTLRGSIDWSWDLLEAWEKATLVQASVFARGFTLEAAEEIIDLSPWPEAPFVMDAIASLVDKSLIRSRDVEGSRAQRLSHFERVFSMLSSIQAYAAEKLDHEGFDARQAVEARHGDYYAQFGEEQALDALCRHGGVQRLLVLDAERDNLTAAARRASMRGDHAIASKTAMAAAEVFELRGPMSLGASFLEEVLRAIDADAPAQIRARLGVAHT